MKIYQYVIMNKKGEYQRSVTEGLDFYIAYGSLKKADLYDTRDDAAFCIQKGDKIKKLTFVLVDPGNPNQTDDKSNMRIEWD